MLGHMNSGRKKHNPERQKKTEGFPPNATAFVHPRKSAVTKDTGENFTQITTPAVDTHTE